MLPLMTPTGGASRQDVNVQSEKVNYKWTETTPSALIEYFEKYIWDWVKPMSRVMILKTKPGARNREHIDCSPKAFNEKQLKLRIVLQSETNGLYFTTNQNSIYAPTTERPYLIDGSWPHDMANESDSEKYTICLSAPWTSSDFFPIFEKVIYRDRESLPENYRTFFDEKYGHAL